MVAELVIFVANGENETKVIDENGLRLLSFFKNIGITSFTTALQNINSGNLKQVSASKKRVSTQLAEQVIFLKRLDSFHETRWEILEKYFNYRMQRIANPCCSKCNQNL